MKHDGGTHAKRLYHGMGESEGGNVLIFIEILLHDPQTSNFVLLLPAHALHISSHSGDFSARAFPPAASRKQ